jgi:acyl-coenzyme A synthetase/AMP-(fatty) acid ligase
VRHALADRLADYKIPRHVYLVAELPRNANGKVVRTKVRDVINQHLS